MSTHVVGFRPPDEKWEKMKNVWESCHRAGIEAPKEVCEFFEWEEPDKNGVIVEIENTDAVKEYNKDMREGFEVDIDKLPKDVKIIRFYNAY